MGAIAANKSKDDLFYCWRVKGHHLFLLAGNYHFIVAAKGHTARLGNAQDRFYCVIANAGDIWTTDGPSTRLGAKIRL
jgi:hypothetical protein